MADKDTQRRDFALDAQNSTATADTSRSGTGLKSIISYPMEGEGAADFVLTIVPQRGGETTQKHYREVECSHCFQLLPKNQMTMHEVQEISGESSGSSWGSQASSGTNSKGRYQPSRVQASRRTGRSSGRTYYRYVKIWLCPTCEAKYIEKADAKSAAIKNTVFIVVMAIILLIFGLVAMQRR